ncbi:gamma-glutamyltransferase [Paradesulfitobacterium ferrireducens]|uniref:gamma-glutamyltransferase n=1 Tax=Paradesulfitobacterium ferrireducens TaxID=2816476 RepID=UPI001A8F35DC|nr:gamma-glutamyltransferase [Paradesulfitobacterium ferrireducens]
MNFDSLYYPYPSQRVAVYAQNGMVATSQHLAAQGGLDILKKGGNAIDAAIATAACLTVLEPTSNGIGSDAFALVWTNGELYGLNASGPSPQTLSLETVLKMGYKQMPKYGWIPVTVPGAPAGWAALSSRFGKIPFADCLKPAIEYAEKGYPLSPVLAKYWATSFATYSEALRGPEFANWFATFAPKGRAPVAGEIWNSPDHAQSLQLIAETKAEALYRGELAEKIDQFSRQFGGYLSKQDLENFSPQWVKPIKVRYRGYDVWEIPPNGQGLVTLLALNILDRFEFAERDTTETFHTQIEALKLAFADGKRYITDPEKMSVKIEDLLSKAYAEERSQLIKETASFPEAGKPTGSGTVYLAAADDSGNMVSYIQSNYMGFGSGLVVPGTGISLQNRGNNFSLDPAAANRLEPGKRTYHTIIPGFLTKDHGPIGSFGVMGGFMQPQGHLQVIMNTVDFHLNPQAAIDAPRWRWIGDRSIELEHSFPPHLAEALARRGHNVNMVLDPYGFGRGQIIWKDQKTGVLTGGTDSRTDGMVACW